MGLATFSVSTDSSLKEKAEAIFDELGFDISTAITMFLKQAVYQEGLPFDVKIKNNTRDYNPLYLLEPDTTKTPTPGRLNGCIKIPNDFNEPLEEMKEYMY